LSINFHHSSEFFVVSGTNKIAQLLTRDGGYLMDVVEKQDWIWGCRVF
jgi:hypothetical protein